MLMKIYGRAFNVLMKKPLKLWGLSLLFVALSTVLPVLCGVAIPALGLAVVMLLSTSMTMVFLYGYRGENVKVVQLFSCFKDWQTIKRVVFGMAWMGLWIFLWGLIPVVGPIFSLIRTYEYRLTPYILVTEPDVCLTDAIKLSSERTKGYKLQMWLADFVHAAIFAVAFLIISLLAKIPYIGILFTLVLVILCIVYFALVALFAGLVQAAFYEEITSGSSKCSSCGAKLATGAEFCSSCGKPVN